jgi:hypothetical protein
MKVIEKRLRWLERGLLLPVETEASRRAYDLVLEIRRRRAKRLGLPVPDDPPRLEGRLRTSGIAETIRARRQLMIAANSTLTGGRRQQQA